MCDNIFLLQIHALGWEKMKKCKTIKLHFRKWRKRAAGYFHELQDKTLLATRNQTCWVWKFFLKALARFLRNCAAMYICKCKWKHVSMELGNVMYLQKICTTTSLHHYCFPLQLMCKKVFDFGNSPVFFERSSVNNYEKIWKAAATNNLSIVVPLLTCCFRSIGK